MLLLDGRLRFLAVVAACAFSTPTAASAACDKPAAARDVSQWPATTELVTGSRVRIVATTGSHQGKLLSLDSSRVRVDVSGKPVDVERTAVVSLFSVCGMSKRAVVIGAAVGAVVGVGQGVLTTESNRVAWSAVFGSIWAGLGALAGRSFPAEHLVYRR